MLVLIFQNFSCKSMKVNVLYNNCVHSTHAAVNDGDYKDLYIFYFITIRRILAFKIHIHSNKKSLHHESDLLFLRRDSCIFFINFIETIFFHEFLFLCAKHSNIIKRSETTAHLSFIMIGDHYFPCMSSCCNNEKLDQEGMSDDFLFLFFEHCCQLNINNDIKQAGFFFTFF